jgi:OCT family organic cation transporter-like MFS transporter 4/5
MSVSSVFIGFGLGNFAGGILAARHGRRMACVWGALATGLLSLAAAFSPDVGILSAIHVGIGIAAGVSNCAGWTLVMEFVDADSRAFGGGVVWAFWTAWMMAGALIAYLTDAHTGAWVGGFAGWRMTKIFMSLPAIVFSSLAVWALPESPRFLAQRGDTEGARRILARVARANGRIELMLDVDGEGNDGAETDGDSAAAKTEDPQAVADKATRTCDLLAAGHRVRGMPIRRMVLATAYLWFAATLSYYGLSISISDMAGSVYVNNLLSSALEGPAYAFTGLFCGYFGRKGVMCFTLASSGVCCIVLAAAGDSASQPGWRVLAFVAKFGATLAFSAVYVWTAELFPTDIRTVAFGLCNVVARSGGMLAPVIVQLSSISKMVPSLVFGVIALSGSLVCILLPETVGLPLEEHTTWVKHQGRRGNVTNVTRAAITRTAITQTAAEPLLRDTDVSAA